MSKKKYKLISLFAGIGGIEYGFEKTKGFKTIWANEIDKNAYLTYSLNFKNKLIVEDITNINVKIIPKADIIVAGFPCQPFSVAGYRKGFEDQRGDLFFQIIRLVKEIHPRVIFLENVKNLLGHDNGKTYKIIEESLKCYGYNIGFSEVLNSKKYGNIPQNRERIYIIAFKNESDLANFSTIDEIPLNKDIISILDSIVPEIYFYSKEKTKIYENLLSEINEENVAYQWRRKYVRKNQSGVFPTLTANMGTGGHNVPLIYQNGSIRKITPRECFRLQGFDDNFKLPDIIDSHLYKQVGNSVVVTVIERLAEKIYIALQKTDGNI